MTKFSKPLLMLVVAFSFNSVFTSNLSAAKLDPCSLLTKDEVKAIIKEPVTKAEAGGAPDGTDFCHWYGSDEKLFQKGISLMVKTSNGKELYKGLKNLADEAVPVKDLGDEAFTMKSEKSGVTLYKGNVFIRVTPLYLGGEITVAHCKSLALKALARAK